MPGPTLRLHEGKPVAIKVINDSGYPNIVEITKVGDTVTSGVMKDTISIPRFRTAEVDFVANDPGLTMLHCHHQAHLDEGFAGVFTYA